MMELEIDKALIDLALHNEWQAALERAQAFPSEIYHQRPFDGLNVLHMAAGSKEANVGVFERVYEIDPQHFAQAASTTDARGMTPLLVACANRASLAVIRFLVQNTPSSAIPQTDKDGWSALSFLACWPLAAWRTSDENVEAGGGNLSLRESILPLAAALLKIDANMATRRNKVGFTPLHLLVSTHQLELQFFYHYFSSTVTTNNTRDDDDGDMLMEPRERQSSLHDLWQVIQLFVSSGDDNDVGILHKCLAIPSCPVLLVMLSCRMNPEQLLEGDNDGNTPIHVAVLHKQSFLITYLLNLQPEAAKKVNQHGETPFCISRKKWNKWNPKVHNSLLHASPSAVHKAKIHPSFYAKIMERLLKATNKETKRDTVHHTMMPRLTESQEASCSHSTIFEMIQSASF